MMQVTFRTKARRTQRDLWVFEILCALCAFVRGKNWKTNQCHLRQNVPVPSESLTSHPTTTRLREGGAIFALAAGQFYRLCPVGHAHHSKQLPHQFQYRRRPVQR